MNKAILYSVLSAAVGFAAGIAVGHFTTKAKCQKEKEEEINELRSYYKEFAGGVSVGYFTAKSKFQKENEEKIDIDDVPNVKVVAKTAINKPSYEDIVSTEGYNKKEERKVTTRRPYVISSEEFMESDLESVVLLYFADGVLTDDEYEPVDDPYETIGIDLPYDGFPETKDSIFVHNPKMNLDYEILRDLRDYADVVDLNKE